MRTFMSLTHAACALRRVLLARSMPCLMAPSNPSVEVELISVTVSVTVAALKTYLLVPIHTAYGAGEYPGVEAG